MPNINLMSHNGTVSIIPNNIQSEPVLPKSLRFNRNTMSISINHSKNEILHKSFEPDYVMSNTELESITCLPTLAKLHSELITDLNKTSEDLNAEDVIKTKSHKLLHYIKSKCTNDPLRRAVILRCPRGNQPRNYTTDSLYAALMDVKSGESIYR